MSTHNICFCAEIRKSLCGYPTLIWSYEGSAKSFVTGFGLLQCCFIKHIFITNLQSISPLLKYTFVTFLPKQINSLLLVSVGDTDKQRCQENF